MKMNLMISLIKKSYQSINEVTWSLVKKERTDFEVNKRRTLYLQITVFRKEVYSGNPLYRGYDGERMERLMIP